MLKRAAGLARKTPMPRATAGLQRSPMKRRTPKKRAGHAPAYLAACRGEACYLQIAGVCRGESETVVPCHANWSDYGKAMGRKADDIYTVPGCWRCHRELDQGFSLTNEQKRSYWEWAYTRWTGPRAIKMGHA